MFVFPVMLVMALVVMTFMVMIMPAMAGAMLVVMDRGVYEQHQQHAEKYTDGG